MTMFIVTYNGLFEVEARDKQTAELLFEQAAQHLMDQGCVAYLSPLTEAEFDPPKPTQETLL